MATTKDKVTELERQAKAVWDKYEKLEKQASDEKLADVKWKTEVQTGLETKMGMIEKLVYAILAVTVLAVIAIVIQYSFDFIKKGGF